MSQTRHNHFVPQWYQSGFVDERDDKLRHFKRRQIALKDGVTKTINSKNWFTSAQCFYGEDLYSTFFGTAVNDDIEKKLFGPIDDSGANAVRAYSSDDIVQWNDNFQDFFTYLDAQKLRTPKGLDWIKSKYPELSQIQLMTEMQALRTMHCTLWTEGVREIVSAEDSEVKFILSDHPITIYNYACPPDSESCRYPNDPDIALKGSQTIFPLNKNRCLILTNLEYARDPDKVDPLSQRTNATKKRRSMVSSINFINKRKLTSDEITKINYIIKARARESIAGGRESWLYPEETVKDLWGDLRHVLIPPAAELYNFGGEMYAGFKDGSTHYQDAFGRTTPQNENLRKETDESKLDKDDNCGCGSYRTYQNCCRDLPKELRTSWAELSIRERNLAFCRAIKGILGLDSGKTWLDVQHEISEDQIAGIYGFYSRLWPRETDIYSLLPKSDGRFRALYTGILDVRVVGFQALPMASLFDELLLESPIVNPNIVKPEFDPTKVPDIYKYQAIKDIALMLDLEPYIGYGLINLFPDPNNFDLDLMKAAMDMASSRRGTVASQRDKETFEKLGIEDYLNIIFKFPRKVKIMSLVSEFGIPESIAINLIDDLEKSDKVSHLAMLQPVRQVKRGQFMQYSMVPNYEMSLFVAQVTGSVIVTDSETRWLEFQSAQCRQNDTTIYPWNEFYSKVSLIPLDYGMLESFTKSQDHFAVARSVLKRADRLVLANENDSNQLGELSESIIRLNRKLVEINSAEPAAYENGKCHICVPQGGIFDSKVQRLLALSSCLRYDHKVRAVYYLESIF